MDSSIRQTSGGLSGYSFMCAEIPAPHPVRLSLGWICAQLCAQTLVFKKKTAPSKTLKTVGMTVTPPDGFEPSTDCLSAVIAGGTFAGNSLSALLGSTELASPEAINPLR
ncbi:hypothetical protein OAE57_02310 [Synechococcus sp. AH-551-C10]|nr:hypothetical protein [Synechococcus sp. AH-551-C10]MDB4659886.1 hypothetical protein [Synechococcus sp. AH-551-C10]